jgi:hypothetical protein
MKLRVISGVVAVLAVAAVLAVVFWPSSDVPSSNGPFGPSGPTVNAACVPSSGRIVTYAGETINNTSKADATIQRISYVHPRNFQVLYWFAAPLGGHRPTLFASFSGYPPRWLLAERTRVIGPGGVNHSYALVIVTRLTRPVGHADAVYVNYTQNGTRYTLRTITAIQVVQRPRGCGMNPPL